MAGLQNEKLKWWRPVDHPSELFVEWWNNLLFKKIWKGVINTTLHCFFFWPHTLCSILSLCILDFEMERIKKYNFFPFDKSWVKLQLGNRFSDYSEGQITNWEYSPVPFLIETTVELIKLYHILKLSKRHGNSTVPSALATIQLCLWTVLGFSHITATTYQWPFPKRWLLAEN